MQEEHGNQPDVIGRRIVRLLQTSPERAGVWIEEFGEAYCIALVAQLDDGSLLYVQEFKCVWWTEGSGSLRGVELVQPEHSLADVEGHTIEGLADGAGDFALALDNGLYLNCPSGPGGNYPWLYTASDVEADIRAEQ